MPLVPAFGSIRTAAASGRPRVDRLADGCALRARAHSSSEVEPNGQRYAYGRRHVVDVEGGRVDLRAASRLSPLKAIAA